MRRAARQQAAALIGPNSARPKLCCVERHQSEHSGRALCRRTSSGQCNASGPMNPALRRITPVGFMTGDEHSAYGFAPVVVPVVVPVASGGLPRRASRRAWRASRLACRLSRRASRLSCRRSMPAVCASVSDAPSSTAGTAKLSAAGAVAKSESTARRDMSFIGVRSSFMLNLLSLASTNTVSARRRGNSIICKCIKMIHRHRSSMC